MYALNGTLQARKGKNGGEWRDPEKLGEVQ